MKTKILSFLLLLSITLNSQTRVSTLAGTTTPASFYIQNHYYNNGNPATFHFPVGVTTTPDGNTYVIENGMYMIRKIAPDGFTSEFSGNADWVSPSYTGFGFTDGTLLQARYKAPQGLASNAGVIFVADTYNKAIRKIVGVNVSTVATGFIQPNALCVDSANAIYVADKTCVKIITPSGIISTLAGSAVAGNLDGSLASSRFRNIEFITFDQTGNTLYVSDTGNTALRKINLNTGVVSTVTVSAVDSGVTYTLVNPSGLAFKNGLFIADRGGHVIFKIDTSNNVTRVAGNGKPKFRDGLAGVGAFDASFYAPEGIAFDSSGNLIVVDAGNSRIRKIQF